MRKTLALVVLMSSLADAAPRCKVTPAPPDAVFVGPKRVRVPLGKPVFEEDAAGRRPRLGLVPRGATWLMGISPEWMAQYGGAPDGRLYEVTCGKSPTVRVVLEREGTDFGRLVTPDSGKTWIAGGSGGLVSIDAATLAVTPLTTPPKLTPTECPLAAADTGVTQSDVLPALGPRPGELTFVRGAPCGYEADFTGRTRVLTLSTGATRTLQAVPVVAEAADGTLWAGDAAACDEPGPEEPQTPGTIFRSSDGGVTWERVSLVDKPGGTAGGWEPDTAVADVLIDRRDALRVLVRTTVCRSSAVARGGSLFETRDGGATWKAVPPPDGEGDGGMGLLALRRVGPTLDRVAAASDVEGKLVWRMTADGGRTWTKLARPPAAPSRPGPSLARLLGVSAVNGTLKHTKTGATLAWTSDGLYRRVKTTWERVTLP